MVDCSNITDSDLTQQILGLWEPGERTTVIPYSFSGALSREQLLLYLDDNMMAKMSVSEHFIQLMRNALLHIQRLSEGLIKFEEKDFLANSDKGILLTTCGDLADFVKKERHGFAAYWVDDVTHFFQKVLVCFPKGAIEKESAYWERIRFHELLHAIGVAHFHEGIVGEKLKQILLGQMCSVMPYNTLIETPMSHCPLSECPEGIIGQPGPLDKRWIRVAYDSDLGVAPQHKTAALKHEMVREGGGACAILLMMAGTAAFKKIARRLIEQHYEHEQTPARLRLKNQCLALASFALDLVIGVSLRATGMLNSQQQSALNNFLLVRGVAAAMRMVNQPTVCKAGRLLSHDGFWHAFFTLTFMQQRHMLGGEPVEFTNGIMHGVSSAVGCYLPDVALSFWSKKQRPMSVPAPSPSDGVPYRPSLV